MGRLNVEPEARQHALFHALTLARSLLSLPIHELLAEETDDEVIIVTLRVLAEAKDKLDGFAELRYGKVQKQ